MSDEQKYGRFPPFSLRLSFDERSRLEQAAGKMPLGAYIRQKALDGITSTRKTIRKSRRPIKDDQAMAQLLAELGKAHLANNLNQLAKAVNSGSLPVTPDTEKAILDAYYDILWMRKTLGTALGLELDHGGVKIDFEGK
jgi:hypothetical protein